MRVENGKNMGTFNLNTLNKIVNTVRPTVSYMSLSTLFLFSISIVVE